MLSTVIAALFLNLPANPITLILIAVAVILVIVILATGYLKAPPDTAFIISGLRKGSPQLLSQCL